MSSGDSEQRNFELHDDLPAVQPPSTSFFVQLFLLPAVIVFALVAVWYLFGKITDAQGSPEEFLARMETNRRDRWKAAHDLSMLLTPKSQYVTDSNLALKVSQALEKALEEPDQSKEHADYLEYLAGALGRFDLNVGVPALRHATNPKYPAKVRWTALFSLANLASKLGDLDDPNLGLDLRDLIKDENATIRELAAMTLGIVREPAAIEPLTAALQDVEPTVRYNAARSLAKFGNTQGLAVFKDMLDRAQLEQNFTLQDNYGQSIVDVNRVQVVLYEALKGLAELQQVAPEADLEPVVPSVQKLLKDTSPQIVAEAKELLLLLEANPTSSERNNGDE
jgi:HEAT repeat protein